MKKWEYRIKQYELSLNDYDVQIRSKKNYEIEEILSEYGKEGYELVNVISEKVIATDKKKKYLRTFFLKKERLK